MTPLPPEALRLLDAADTMTQEIMRRAVAYVMMPGYVPSSAQARLIAAYAQALTTIVVAGGPEPALLGEKQ